MKNRLTPNPIAVRLKRG